MMLICQENAQVKHVLPCRFLKFEKMNLKRDFIAMQVILKSDEECPHFLNKNRDSELRD